MCGLTSTPVITSSVGFREEAFDELPLARSLAQHLGTEHHEETVTPDSSELLRTWPDTSTNRSPILRRCRPTSSPRWRVGASPWPLSGDGGDEASPATSATITPCSRNVRSTLPRAIRNPLFGLLGRLYPEGAPPPFRAKAFLGDVARAPWEAYFRLMSSVKPADKPELLHADVRQALRGYDSANTFEQLYGEAGDVDLLSRLQYIDFKTYLSDGVLTKVDRTSMANSLEVRCPLLDHRVVEFAAGLPPRLKMHGRHSKLLLRQAASPLLPSDVTRRAKRGFNMPVAQWLRDGLEPIVQRVLIDSTALDGLLERRKVESFWQEHRSGRRDHASALWTLLVLGLWTEQLGQSGSQPH
jgi:asparagine synthase (glutamine-hydrolysing)